MSWTNNWNYWGYSENRKIFAVKYSPISSPSDMQNKREDTEVKGVFGPFFASSGVDAIKRIKERVRRCKTT